MKHQWKKLSFVEQMANIGSEILRADSWKQKGNADYSRMAFIRALDLIDRTYAQPLTQSKLIELARLRELTVDYFAGKNVYQSTNSQWQSYILAFTVAARGNIV